MNSSAATAAAPHGSPSYGQCRSCSAVRRYECVVIENAHEWGPNLGLLLATPQRDAFVICSACDNGLVVPQDFWNAQNDLNPEHVGSH